MQPSTKHSSVYELITLSSQEATVLNFISQKLARFSEPARDRKTNQSVTWFSNISHKASFRVRNCGSLETNRQRATRRQTKHTLDVMPTTLRFRVHAGCRVGVGVRVTGGRRGDAESAREERHHACSQEREMNTPWRHGGSLADEEVGNGI